MAEPFPAEVDLARLGPRTRIGVGGQGSVHALERLPDLVYKEYAPRLVDDVDVATLTRFTELAAECTRAAGEVRQAQTDGRRVEVDPDLMARASLLGLAAWPVSVVRKDGVVRGFLMPRVPARYRVRLRLPSGSSTVLAQTQFLLN